MSEPTAPDSEPTTEPDIELDAETPEAPETAETPELDQAATSEPEAVSDPDAAPDPDAEPVADIAVPVKSDAGQKVNQVIAIVAALVIVVVIGVVVAFAFLGGDDDKAKPVSSEDQAKTAAVAMFKGIYKVARGDTSGCQDLVDNLALTPEQGNFFNDCVAKIPTEAPTAATVVLDSVTPTQVTLDEAAGTGTVVLDVATTENGKSETQPASVPVIKVDGHWKVNLNAKPTP